MRLRHLVLRRGAADSESAPTVTVTVRANRGNRGGRAAASPGLATEVGYQWAAARTVGAEAVDVRLVEHPPGPGTEEEGRFRR
jgi:hypothetical protein